MVVGSVRFGLLGPLEVTVDGRPIEIGTRKERQLLAMLLVDANTVVPTDRLIDGLWAGVPPAKPSASLRAYVSNIRRALGSSGVDGRDLLITDSGGYAIRADYEQLDSARFERLVRDDATSTPDRESEASTLDEALALVRGEPLGDMAYEEFAQQEIRRLTELLLVAEERRAELAIELGDSAGWLPRIAALIVDHPLRERLRAVHMAALAGTGRHAEALRSYQEHRKHLAEEIGIDPGPHLQALEASILANEGTGSLLGESSNMLARAVEAVDEPRTAADPQVPPAPSGAERRQLTVLACGLADAAELTGSLDPEDQRALIGDCHTIWGEAIERFGGRIAGGVGDGIVAHFGYPQAHEDDPERAVRAALDMVADTEMLLHVGIATGPVVVDPDLAGSEVVGEAPSLAVRLRDRLDQSGIVISDRARALTQNAFRIRDLGDGVHRVDGIAPERTAQPATSSPLVGRGEELALLLKRWDLARQGDGQIVLLSGEAGVGKSRLLEAVRDSAASVPRTEALFQCSAFHLNTALHPVIAHVRSLAGIAPDDPMNAITAKLAAIVADSPETSRQSVDLLAALVGANGRALIENEPDPDQRRERLLDAAVQMVEAGATETPVVCIFEDAQWIDPTTLEFLERLVDRAPALPLLLLVVSRSGFEASFEGLANSTSLRLCSVSRSESVAIARRVSGGKPLPTEVEDEIVEKADGIPLFVEEVTQAVLESGILEEDDIGYHLPAPLPALVVPVTLHDSLMARLDRIGSAKAVTQLAAVIGMTFDYGLITAVAEGVAVDRELEQLVASGIVLQVGTPPSATYRFKHGLIRDTAHQSMLRETRRDSHRRVAEILEAQRPDTVSSSPGILAQHWQEAGDIDAAVGYWRLAAEQALETSALRETIENASRGLALVEQLDSPARVDAEIELLLTIGAAKVQVLGPSARETREIYDRILGQA
ncbi:MAG: AAA family ATPase, partial [Actinomycetia bacterium]|nr:AAA family ATPase [Actinomycetes bacterium]